MPRTAALLALALAASPWIIRPETPHPRFFGGFSPAAAGFNPHPRTRATPKKQFPISNGVNPAIPEGAFKSAGVDAKGLYTESPNNN